MTRFTNSPYEWAMIEHGREKREKPDPLPVLPKSHPCYGCGNYTDRPCVGFCHRQLRKGGGYGPKTDA